MRKTCETPCDACRMLNIYKQNHIIKTIQQKNYKFKIHNY